MSEVLHSARESLLDALGKASMAKKGLNIDLTADTVHEIAMDKTLPDDEEFLEMLDRLKERNCPEKPDGSA